MFQKFLDLCLCSNGRLNRLEFLVLNVVFGISMIVFHILSVAMLYGIAACTGDCEAVTQFLFTNDGTQAPLSFVTMLALGIWGLFKFFLLCLSIMAPLCFAARRMHDTNRSGGVLALWIGTVVLLGFLNIFGDLPIGNLLVSWVSIILLAQTFFIELYLLLVPGTKDENSYGEERKKFSFQHD